MQDFQRKKDSFLMFNSMSQRDNSFMYSEQSKNLYDFVLKHDNQIKRIENEVTNLKSQILDIKMKFPVNSQTSVLSNNFLSYDENNTNNSYLNKIIQIKEDIKNDILLEVFF